MKFFAFFLFLLVPAAIISAKHTNGFAQVLQTKVKDFKRVMDTSGILPINNLGYSVILGSNTIDTTDFCFSINLVTNARELDDIFLNYYYILEGHLVVLYINHPSMLYLVEEMGAQKITKAKREELRTLLNNFPWFLSRRPYQICCSKDGQLSGDIIFPQHESKPGPMKPMGIPLALPKSLSR
jgi:hypothetical protein